MIDLRSARRQAYRYGRQAALLDQENRRYVEYAWSTFLAQFSADDISGDVVAYLSTSYRAGIDGDAVTDEANAYRM